MPATTVGIAAGTTAAAAWNASMVSLAIGTAMSAAQSIMQGRQQAQQAKIQSKQAKYQSEVAQQNQEIARQEARAKARQGMENAYAVRRKAVTEASQRAAQEGASGLVAGYGSFEDIDRDQLTKYETDAQSALQKGYDDAYNSEIAAWGYGNQAAGYQMQEEAYDSRVGSSYLAGGLGALGSIAGGIADFGSTWNKFRTPDDAANKESKKV